MGSSSTLYSLVTEPKDNLPLKARINVKGPNTDFSLDRNIENVCVIDGPTFSGISNETYVDMFGKKTLYFMPSFNTLDYHNEIDVTEYHNTNLQNLVVPKIYENESWVKLIRLFTNLTYHEVCRIFNHASCWVHCMKINKPLLILERGSGLLTSHNMHVPMGSINALGANKIHMINENLLCNPSPWAYSVDPVSAKILFESLIGNGITDPLPTFMNLDKLSIVCFKKAYRIMKIDITENMNLSRL